MGNVCILISTCERYRPMARFTVQQIRKYWDTPPPLLSCGLESALEDSCTALSLRDDPKNWMAVTLSACRDLKSKGFSRAYVILDDHPPLARCHAEHLNVTIPAMMTELGATSISLSGYGQRRRRMGQIVHWRSWDIDKVPATELWKFPLHPALWNLDALQTILEHLIQTLPVAEQTPWAFERKGGDPDSTLPENLKSNCYRLCGEQMTARAGYKLRHFPLCLAQLAADGMRFFARILGGHKARKAADATFRWLDCPYDGPYPLFWSGLMTKGKINPHLATYLSVTGKRNLLSVIESVSTSPKT